MYAKKITYTDYDGNSRTETFLFHMNKIDILRLNAKNHGNLERVLERIQKEDDSEAMFELFEDIVLSAYGEKSIDGKQFVKSKEKSEAFKQTEAYSEFLYELLTVPESANEFMMNMVPSDIREAIATPILAEA